MLKKYEAIKMVMETLEVMAIDLPKDSNSIFYLVNAHARQAHGVDRLKREQKTVGEVPCLSSLFAPQI